MRPDEEVTRGSCACHGYTSHVRGGHHEDTYLAHGRMALADRAPRRVRKSHHGSADAGLLLDGEPLWRLTIYLFSRGGLGLMSAGHRPRHTIADELGIRSLDSLRTSAEVDLRWDKAATVRDNAAADGLITSCWGIDLGLDPRFVAGGAACGTGRHTPLPETRSLYTAQNSTLRSLSLLGPKPTSGPGDVVVSKSGADGIVLTRTSAVAGGVFAPQSNTKH